jgi:NitT/TauT family transport system ATP-binding protein
MKISERARCDDGVSGFGTSALWFICKCRRPPGPDRPVVFQSSALFPWMSVQENLEFGLLSSGLAQNDISERARDMAGEFGLSEFLAAYPKTLSGGMARICEVLRAILPTPQCFLADEPLAELDEFSRIQAQVFLQKVWLQHPTTTIFVTHSLEEAIFLSDRILVFSPRPGRVVYEMRISLPRPRTAQMRVSPEFQLIRQELMQSLLDNGSVPAQVQL